MRVPTTSHRLRVVLTADALVELLLAALLMAIPSTVGRWFAIAPALSVGAGIVFVIAAAAVGAIAYRSTGRREVVRMLALGNVAGGVIGWIILLLAWGALAAPGRALLGTASDVFITLGALELIYLRKSAAQPA